MTEVMFHFNVGDKPSYLPRLLRKARGRGARLVVWCDSVAQSRAFSQALWLETPTGFAPHALADDAERVRAASSVLLTHDLQAADGFSAEVLVNLGSGWPEGFERFARVIEVVSQDAGDRAAARERWRAYRQRGIEPAQHDLSVPSA